MNVIYTIYHSFWLLWYGSEGVSIDPFGYVPACSYVVVLFHTKNFKNTLNQ